MLLGRDAEHARLRDLLDRARGGTSAALVIRGDPGIGKSALLDDAVAAANGMTVLRARGVESESELSFAGLADLLGPVVGRLDALPPPQRAALAGALALGPPVRGDRFTVYAATLSLLANAAERAPVLAVVDDAPWIDPPSREALVFAARRLGEEGVVLLFAARTGEPSDRGGRGRGAGARRPRCRCLGRAAGGRRREPPGVARVLFAATGGNPLALLELSGLLTAAQRAGTEPIERSGAGRRGVEARVRAPARRAARSDSPRTGGGRRERVGSARRACSRAGGARARHGGAGARRDGRPDRGRGRPGGVPASAAALGRLPRHAGPGAARGACCARRGAHRGPARAWHLAAATVAADEEVAAALAEAAGAARGRGGPAAAMRAAERAARLTPDPERRAGRLLEAANDMARTGVPERAQALLGEALELTHDPRLRADVQLLAALIEARSGAARAAAELLVAEAERVEPIDPVRAATMIMAAVQPCFEAGENTLMLETARRGMALAERTGLGPMPAGLPLAMALLLSNERDRARDLLVSAAEWMEAADDPWALGPVLIFGIGQAFTWLEDYDRARGLLEGGIAQARAWSAPGLLPYGLLAISELDFRTGRWASAYAAGAESARLGEETGQLNDMAYALCVLSRVEAALGHEQDCRANLAHALALVERLGAESLRAHVGATLGLLELGLGRAEEAVVELEAVERFSQRPARDDPAVLQWAPDLIEAYVRHGRRADAAAALAEFEQDAAPAAPLGRRRRPRAAAGCWPTRTRSRASSADRAWPCTSPVRVRSDRARARRAPAARGPAWRRASLRAALEGFERLGARHGPSGCGRSCARPASASSAGHRPRPSG